ncbi:MAG TPA: IS5 family transposase [Nitrospira sp.]|nr:IS5 family transposase [Nitrospira sp.]
MSDPGVEGALYDSLVMRGFVDIDLGREPAPDETTVCKFRYLLERHELGRPMLKQVNDYLEKHGSQISNETIIDATILGAPSSTKNKSGERDPEMHQVKKGNQYHFGMKALVGVDSETKLTHSVAATAANVADSHVLPKLLHGEETGAWATRRIRGRPRSSGNALPRHHRPHQPAVAHQAEDLSRDPRTELHPEQNTFASRACLRLIKLKFDFNKVRYRGLAKNLNRLLSTYALLTS